MKFRGECFDHDELRKLAPSLFPETPYVLLFPKPFADAFSRVQVVYWSTADAVEDCIIADRVKNMAIDVAVDGIALSFKSKSVFSPAAYLRPIIENADSFEFYQSRSQLIDSVVREQVLQVQEIFISTAQDKHSDVGAAFLCFPLSQ